MNKAKKFANYKGRTYLLLYQGQNAGKIITKLGFMDGSSEFWARDGEPVTPCEAPPTKGRLRSSWRPCGYPGCSPGWCDECL